MVEFGDYQDHFSARFNQETKDDLVLKQVDSEIVRFGIKDLFIFDLPSDELSTLTAEALIALSSGVDTIALKVPDPSLNSVTIVG
ncbi:MAG: hypothetical protein L0H53_02355 [Candidatus Nitrosocosmicus sp.]|nr:hypothetical protein [Candidatus Nitrosocosmicus sp.]MDN5867230.1 hypothetical protein [Candidatus Nitrosocosmicus sp.]